MMNSGITVSDLEIICRSLIESGYGDKEVLISRDDEGNGFHTLWGEVYYEEDEIREIKSFTPFHGNNNPKDVVLFA